MRKLSIFLIVFLFMIMTVSAVDFSLNLGEKTEYGGRDIKFVSIGTKGSAVIEVDDMGFVLKKNSFMDTYGLRVTLIGSTYLPTIDGSNIIINVEPLSTMCLESNRCELNGDCYDKGSVIDIDGVLSYCDISWVNQKVLGEECIEDYECLDSICDGVCNNNNAITGGSVDSVGVKDNRVIGLLMMLIVVFLLYYFLKKKDFK